MENIKTNKLYAKAKLNKIEANEKPQTILKNSIIKKSIIPSNTSNKPVSVIQEQDKAENSKNHTGDIKSQIEIDSRKFQESENKDKKSSIKEKNSKTLYNSTKLSNNLALQNNNTKIKTNPRILNTKQKNFRDYLKQNILQTIQMYMDSATLLNFMLSCKKFSISIKENDELFFLHYIKRFKSKKTNYNDHRGQWKEVFLKSISQIHQTNYDSLKTKFLKNSVKNCYQAKKDVYFLTNNLYQFMKPIYHLIIDGKHFKIKHILSEKILSHVNFFANFDDNNIELDKIKNLKLSITEKNLGLYNINLLTYDFKKISFQEYKSNSKICKIFFHKDIIISTFEKTFLFFLNISLPICKITESLFDFLTGLHVIDKNLNYFDDIDSNFGLFDYSLLINIKSWNNIFFTLNVNTLDFKLGEEFLTYENSGKIVTSVKPNFEIRTIALSEKFFDFLICDITLLSYKGEHIICDSMPMRLEKDTNRFTYEEYEFDFYTSIVKNENYEVAMDFEFNDDISMYCMDKFKLKVGKKFIFEIFKIKLGK